MRYQCIECLSKFSEADAVCENIRDKKRAFGCPNCGTFYIKVGISNKIKLIRAVFISIGIVMPSAAIILMQSDWHGYEQYISHLSKLIGLSGMVLIFSEFGKGVSLERTGYRYAAGKSS